MKYAVQWLLSLIFIIQMYAVMIVVCAICTPPALFWRGASYAWMQMFCKWTLYSAEKIIGLRTEVRGEIPKGATLIASKHQSFLDIIVLFSVLDAPRFIMKKQLVAIPIMGWHALRIGCIPVDRGKRGQAINKMMADVTSGQEKPGQLIIYPQGTRVAPGGRGGRTKRALPRSTVSWASLAFPLPRTLASFGHANGFTGNGASLLSNSCHLYRQGCRTKTL